MRNSKARLFTEISTEVDDRRVIRAMQQVPREEFVPASIRYRSYENVALPIGYGQTISQPLMVGLMVSAMMVKRSDTVLEVGTGSGYQAAVLSCLAGRVVSVERVPELAATAAHKLNELGHKNVELFPAGDSLGLPSKSPYEAIVVAASAPRLPRILVNQLAPGGRLVIPVGNAETQELMRIIRGPHDFSIHTLGGCRFVPLIGEGAWLESDPELRNAMKRVDL